jgi:hypothetical protein
MQQSPPPHVIRLRDPWERRILSDTPAVAEATQPGSTKQSVTTICFSRRFGLPTGLHEGDRIDLVLENASATGRVLLNGLMLGEIIENQRQQRFPITNLLQNRNQLGIEIDSTDPDRSLHDFVAEVRLEIFAKPEA